MTTITVEATLHSDGVTLHLEKKLALPPGRVTLTVQSAGGCEEQSRFISDPRPTQAELEQLLGDLAAGPPLPVLPVDFSRADIYDDHD